jgi:hypothetical protein
MTASISDKDRVPLKTDLGFFPSCAGAGCVLDVARPECVHHIVRNNGLYSSCLASAASFNGTKTPMNPRGK